MKNKKKDVKKERKKNMSLAVFFVVWSALGLAGFFTSIACLWYSSLMWGVVGLLASVILGPFYWIFFLIMREYKLYCSNDGGVPKELEPLVKMKKTRKASPSKKKTTNKKR